MLQLRFGKAAHLPCQCDNAVGGNTQKQIFLANKLAKYDRPRQSRLGRDLAKCQIFYAFALCHCARGPQNRGPCVAAIGGHHLRLESLHRALARLTDWQEGITKRQNRLFDLKTNCRCRLYSLYGERDVAKWPISLNP